MEFASLSTLYEEREFLFCLPALCRIRLDGTDYDTSVMFYGRLISWPEAYTKNKVKIKSKIYFIY